MAYSKVGQYSLEYRLEGFTSPTRSHALRAWISPLGTPAIGALPAAIDIQKLGGGTADLGTVANQLWSYLRLMYASSVSAVSYTLWKFATENSRDFVSAGTLTTPAGASGSVQVAQQTTLTFRHALGGIGKLVFLESNQSGDTRTALIPNTLGTPTQRIAAYAMSADSVLIALDNSFPVTPLRDSRGQNEAVWRLIYRSGS